LWFLLKSAACLGVVFWLIAAREAPTPGPQPAPGVTARHKPAPRPAAPDPLAGALDAASARLGRAALEHCAANPAQCLEAADVLRRARAAPAKAAP